MHGPLLSGMGSPYEAAVYCTRERCGAVLRVRMHTTRRYDRKFRTRDDLRYGALSHIQRPSVWPPAPVHL